MSLEEAALDLGAKPFRVVRDITPALVSTRYDSEMASSVYAIACCRLGQHYSSNANRFKNPPWHKTDICELDTLLRATEAIGVIIATLIVLRQQKLQRQAESLS